MEYPIYGHLDNDLVEQVGGKLMLKKSTTDKIQAQAAEDGIMEFTTDAALIYAIQQNQLFPGGLYKSLEKPEYLYVALGTGSIQNILHPEVETGTETELFLKWDGTKFTVQTAADHKTDLSINPTAVSSGDITFEAPHIFGTSVAPYTTNLTHDLTGAVLGITQKIYSTKSAEPTYPTGWVKIGTGTYTSGALNIIYAEFCGGTRVEYWIVTGA